MWLSNPNYNGAGSYAEYVACPQDRVYRLPDHISFKEGAALGMSSLTACKALFDGFV